MRQSIFQLAVLALPSIVSAAPNLVGRQHASDQAEFVSAADALISSYIPSNVVAAVTPALESAISAAGATGDPKAVLYSALEANTRPPWLSVIPSAYSAQVTALEGAIDGLRPLPVTVVLYTTVGTDSAGHTFTSVASTTVPVTVVPTTVVVKPSTTIIGIITGTDAHGSTFTSFTTTVEALSPVIVTATGASLTSTFTVLEAVTPSVYTTSGTDTAGSSFTSTVTVLVPDIQPVATVVPTVLVETTTNSQGSTITTSIATSTTIEAKPAKGTSTSNLASAPTGLGLSAAGVIALVGLAIAL